MNTAKIVESKQWTLKARDFVKGLVIAVISPVFTVLIDSIVKDGFNIDLNLIGTVAAIAFLSYLSKNLGDPTQTAEITKPIKKQK